MLKIVLPQTMAQIEKEAIKKGCDQAVFMEKAGLNTAFFLKTLVNCHDFTFYFLLGKGNNAGDALVSALHLLKMGFKLLVYALFAFDECSELCQKHWNDFKKSNGQIILVHSKIELKFDKPGCIVDGIFGTGFSNEVTGIVFDAISQANSSHLPIIAIDIPSGLNGADGQVNPIALRADYTLALGLPKLGYFINQGWNHVGKIVNIDFGLPDMFKEQAESSFNLVSENLVINLLPYIQRTRHKYQAGHVLGIAGSENMPGAGALSSLAALRSGAGIVRLGFSKEHRNLLAHLSWEILPEPFEKIKDIESFFSRIDSLYIGPGLGHGNFERGVVKSLLDQIKSPYILDADALNIIAEENITFFPNQGILTPHIGEMQKLLEIKYDPQSSLNFLKETQKYSSKKNVVIVLKGAPTFIFHPQKNPLIVCEGDPGMATAGSGDVLTGIIAGLLAQKLNPYEAAIVGTYLHGLAGEIAAKNKTSYSLIARDIIENLPKAFQKLIELA